MGRLVTGADIAKFNKTNEALELRIVDLERRVAVLEGARPTAPPPPAPPAQKPQPAMVLEEIKPEDRLE